MFVCLGLTASLVVAGSSLNTPASPVSSADHAHSIVKRDEYVLIDKVMGRRFVWKKFRKDRNLVRIDFSSKSIHFNSNNMLHRQIDR